MKSHEWETQTFDGGHVGDFDITTCKNCGGMIADIFFSLKWNKNPKRIIIPGTRVALPQDCDEALKTMQTYWEKNYKLEVEKRIALNKKESFTVKRT